LGVIVRGGYSDRSGGSGQSGAKAFRDRAMAGLFVQAPSHEGVSRPCGLDPYRKKEAFRLLVVKAKPCGCPANYFPLRYADSSRDKIAVRPALMSHLPPFATWQGFRSGRCPFPQPNRILKGKNMGLDNGLYGKRPNAAEGIFVTFADWRKNWHVHSLLEKAFDGKDEGGFMVIELDAGRLEQVITLLRANPYQRNREDISPFQRAFDELKKGNIARVIYQGNW
jgi:hypothetical protein